MSAAKRRGSFAQHLGEVIGIVTLTAGVVTNDSPTMLMGMLLMVLGVVYKILVGVMLLVGVHREIARSAIEFAQAEAARMKQEK